MGSLPDDASLCSRRAAVFFASRLLFLSGLPIAGTYAPPFVAINRSMAPATMLIWSVKDSHGGADQWFALLVQIPELRVR